MKIPNYKENNIAGVPTYNDDDNIEIDDKKIINECFYIRKFQPLYLKWHNNV